MYTRRITSSGGPYYEMLYPVIISSAAQIRTSANVVIDCKWYPAIGRVKVSVYQSL